MSNLRFASLTWTHDLVFEGGAPGGPSIIVDGNSESGPSPMVTLLMAAASCTGADVALILEKMRASLTDFRIEVQGTRREDDPKRYVAMHFTYHLRGAGVDEIRARRAIDLSIEKYCSVLHSLAPDIAISYSLDLG
jgi:putative redox protein